MFARCLLLVQAHLTLTLALGVGAVVPRHREEVEVQSPFALDLTAGKRQDWGLNPGLFCVNCRTFTTNLL